MSPSLEEIVRGTVARYRMLSPGDRVLAAVSGGPDSVAMLLALAVLSRELGITLAVAHLDHGFRPESGDEADFVRRLAEGMGLPSVVEKADIKGRLKEAGGNKQAVAREVRYGFLARAAEEAGAGGKVAVAHTADDQAETFLMRAMRGSGVSGLSGMPPVRGNIIRPLIEASREDVMRYLREKGEGYAADPSNLEPAYTRNSVRLRLMPLLREYNPEAARALAQAADVMRAEDEFMDAYARDLLAGIMRQEGGGVSLPLGLFRKLPEAVRRRAITLAFERVKGDLLGLSYGHVMDTLGLAAGGGAGRGIDLPGGVRADICYGRLVFSRRAEKTTFLAELPVPGRAEVPELGLTAEARLIAEGEPFAPPAGKFAFFDKKRVGAGPLVIRGRRPGDLFYPQGMPHGSKKLQDYFTDMKLPRAARDRVPLLARGEGGGEIVWVMGMRLDRRFAAGPGCGEMLVVSFEGENEQNP